MPKPRICEHSKTGYTGIEWVCMAPPHEKTPNGHYYMAKPRTENTP